ncbi:type II toxin-antitoxin system VapC family toxin [Rhizobium sp.]
MIVIDTSAIIAIATNEPDARRLMDAINADDEPLISAATLAELLIVAARKGVLQQVERFLAGFGHTTVDVTEHFARLAGAAYTQWGKGLHPAGLNFGDCFAYALAKERNCPLLFIGNDFSKTDIKSALADQDSPT